MALPDPASISAFTSLAVAVIAAIMAGLGYRSFSRTGNTRLLFVVIAFGVFVLKGLFSAYNVLTHTVPHDAIELVLSLLDLIALLLLFIPFVIPRGAA